MAGAWQESDIMAGARPGHRMMGGIRRDLFGPLPVSEGGNRYILEAITIAEKFREEYICRSGICHSDQG